MEGLQSVCLKNHSFPVKPEVKAGNKIIDFNCYSLKW